MKIWNTVNCLTSGITEHEATACGKGRVEISRHKLVYPTYLHGEGKDWHRTEKSAINRANEVKLRKLQSLDKQVKKISSIEFGK